MLVLWSCPRLKPTSVRSIPPQLALKLTPTVTKSPTHWQPACGADSCGSLGWGCRLPGATPSPGLCAFARAGFPVLKDLSVSYLISCPTFMLSCHLV